MQKPNKLALQKVLMRDNLSFSQQQVPDSIVFAINGESLLHRVLLVKDITCGELQRL